MTTYNKIDSLDILGGPILDLPFDKGDGPFASAYDPGAEYDVGASAEGDISMSPNGGSSVLNWGEEYRTFATLRVNDVIPARSFRRVQQAFEAPVAESASGWPVLQLHFSGNRAASTAEKFQGGARIPPIGKGLQLLSDALDAASRTADNESTEADKTIDFRRPLPSSQSFYLVQFRYPRIEFGHPPGMDFAPTSTVGRAASLANETEEFRFNVSADKLINIPYPVGRNIPLTFDLINRGQRSITVALLVFMQIKNERE